MHKELGPLAEAAMHLNQDGYIQLLNNLVLPFVQYLKHEDCQYHGVLTPTSEVHGSKTVWLARQAFGSPLA